MQPVRSGRRRPAFRIALTMIAACGALAHAGQAAACAACGCTLSTNWQTQGINTTPGFSVNLAYSYLSQDQQRYGTGKASSALINSLQAAGQEVEAYTKTQTITASLNYTADTWGINVNVPYLVRSHGTYGTTTPLGSTYLDSSDSSIGDISVLGRYTGFSAQRTAGLIAGIKLPTGSTNTIFNDGTPVDPSLQIGTGSTDLILGGYTSGTVSKYGWFVQGTVQHAIVTKSFNGLDYRPGDTYSLNTGLRAAQFGARFSPMLQFSLVHRRPDGGPAATAPDALTGIPATGGTLLYLAPGATWRAGGGTSIYGFVQLPVYQNVNSLQLVPRYTLTVGVNQAFE